MKRRSFIAGLGGTVLAALGLGAGVDAVGKSVPAFPSDEDIAFALDRGLAEKAQAWRDSRAMMQRPSPTCLSGPRYLKVDWGDGPLKLITYEHNGDVTYHAAYFEACANNGRIDIECPGHTTYVTATAFIRGDGS